VVGAADLVSTVLRNIVRQLATSDHLRGCMTSVNMVFFIGGPQLGETEAGHAVNRMGAPISVVSGGIGCLLTTGCLGWRRPELRNHRRDGATSVAREASTH
jgi:hypothetical protein